MAISTVYAELTETAQAEFSDMVLDARILWMPTGDPHKLRLEIIDQSILDVWLSASGRYSYHWERRYTAKRDLYRYDNAPHQRWQYVSTFRHHFHQGTEDTVVESHLDTRPKEAIRQILTFVRRTLQKEAGSEGASVL
jgi:hypothetical protein